jgi:hypothetical protein
MSHRPSTPRSHRWQTDTLTLLDRVDDRDRAVLAMLLERAHPDDIAATLGLSAAGLRRRRAQIIARLRCPPKRQAQPHRVESQPDPRSMAPRATVSLDLAPLA